MRQTRLFLFLAICLFAMMPFSIIRLSADETDPAADDNPFREKCDTCHGDEVEAKEWAHSGHTKALVTLRESEHPAQDSCLSCHSSGYVSRVNEPWRREKTFTLETAVNAVACSSCHLHSSNREHYLVMSPKKLCVSCHKMDCGCAGAGIIHQSQSEMFLGREGAGVKRMPSPHIKVMEKRCVRCHMAKKAPKDEVAQHGGHTFIADLSVCSDCHEEDMAAKLKTYRQEIQTKMRAVEAMLDSATDSTSEAYKDAKLNYDMVKGDSGYGFHNIPYARALLDYSLSLKSQLVESTVNGEKSTGGE